MRRDSKASFVGSINPHAAVLGNSGGWAFLALSSTLLFFAFASLAQAAAPGVETVGAPVRTATTAQLNGRVNPAGATTTYRFEYGTQGPCSSSPCLSTDPQPAGSGSLILLVSEDIAGLQPDTTYHYRVVADNGEPGSPSFGEDMTVTTRATDTPLSHGDFPGPPGSDRAWEQVNSPDTGGNMVYGATALSDDGNRAVYQVFGGTPDSTIGSFFNQLFAERTSSGWQTKPIYPPRTEAKENYWLEPAGRSDLSAFVAVNFNFTLGAQVSAWRMTPGESATKVFGVDSSAWGAFTAASDDASRTVALLRGSLDPEHPVAPGTQNLYDVSSGTPHLISLLPNETVPACGVSGLPFIFDQRREFHWVSADGRFAFFPSDGKSCGTSQVYARDIEAEATKLVSGPPVSGPHCRAIFIKSVPGAVFFWSKTRIANDDLEPAACNEGDAEDADIYRYDLDSGEVECVTCVAQPKQANVRIPDNPTTASMQLGVAGDGSRVYFMSSAKLLPGVSSPGLYRVNVDSGDLAYVANVSFGGYIGTNNNTMTPDGAVLVFRSAEASLNPLGGQDNGGTEQYYRYDDRDRSLICVSCPQDGSAPRARVTGTSSETLVPAQRVGPNTTPLDEEGDFFFATPTPLVTADQNTAGSGQNPAAGQDVYEWRKGKLFLVTDGITNWPTTSGASIAPMVSGVTPSGRDVFFLAATQLTPDALDGYPRLYTARIGGGIAFPKPPPPCPLEVCQGIPAGAPAEPLPGTKSFSDAGNPNPQSRKARSCAKGKVRRRGRCVRKAKRRNRAANHNRRVSR